jgi:hypothetical protein
MEESCRRVIFERSVVGRSLPALAVWQRCLLSNAVHSTVLFVERDE